MMNVTQQMRAEEINKVQKEYNTLYHKLTSRVDELDIDLIDRLLELERRLTQLEE